MPQGIFTWVGQWLGSPLSTNVYYKNDVVKYNNIVYICVAAVSVPVGSQNPSLDTGNWNVMVSGANGTAGSSGISGSSGTSGIDGTSGTSGVDGSSGTSGQSGSSGTSGESGSSGTSGISGSSGTSGFDGTSGTSGINGTSGANGSSGTSGESGSSGTSGESGSSGTSGIDGTSGTSGVNGTSGTSGANGSSGTSGESGSSGTSGIDGTSGVNGTSGSNGSSGTSGSSGSSGTSGVNGTSGTSGIDGAPGAGGAIGYYGSFYDTTVQTNAGATAANVFTYNTTDINNGVSIVSQSRITIANPGIYDIQFSAQLDKTDAGDDYIFIWLSKNGTNVPDSNTTVFLPKNDAKTAAAWNFLVETTNPNDYFELYWSSTDVDMRIYSEGPSNNPTKPGIPSIILTVTQVMYTQVGPTGASGTSGTSGTSGVSGSSGTSGLNGSSGTSGNSGSSGSSGTSGLTLLTISNKTTDYTVTAADYTSMLIFTSGTTSYVTIDSDANTNPDFPIGGKFQIVRGGTGAVGVTGPGTVTINSVQNFRLLAYQWSEVSAVKTAADTWLLYGGLTGEYVPPVYTLSIDNNSTTATVQTGQANSTLEPAVWTIGSYPVGPGQYAAALNHQAYSGSGAGQLQFTIFISLGQVYWTFKKNGTTMFGPIGPITMNTTAFMGGMSATTSDVLELILSDTP